ncbi:hypothetical protein [Labilibaculum euxinus]|uniref:Uncharacterized protein n=1 Tax=Labilibaculum euxinus TaxID=2686357 RepID=A0A7M4D2D6_9BACT|nr:hypothetical protein [Labilibaculum euxinus]MUP36815.1 hypothetical protein [Labilibaculum euxinus]MVB06020.1 hypothetical protein [Labilibaculum euxinus]
MKKYILATLLIVVVISGYSQSRNYNNISITSRIDGIWNDWTTASDGVLSVAYSGKLPTTIRIFDKSNNQGYLISNISGLKVSRGSSFYSTQIFNFNYYSEINGERQLLQHTNGKPTSISVTKVKRNITVNIFWADKYAEGVWGKLF